MWMIALVEDGHLEHEGGVGALLVGWKLLDGERFDAAASAAVVTVDDAELALANDARG